MAQLYEKAKRANDFQGDHIASVVAHLVNFGAQKIVIDLSGEAVSIESDVKMPSDQDAHLDVVDKGEVIKAEDAVKP